MYISLREQETHGHMTTTYPHELPALLAVIRRACLETWLTAYSGEQKQKRKEGKHTYNKHTYTYNTSTHTYEHDYITPYEHL